ncbi:DUF397 domain-containing protein [Streptomyces sp. CoH27]|nr:DUF397 domain-containing protein [Streptomyces sp. CoH27]
MYVARLASPAPVAVRDGKHDQGEEMTISRAPWAAFVQWAGTQ